MRALLVVNPAATTTTRKGRNVLVRALASDLKLEVEETGHRGHAAALACRAARDGVDLVVALGGDGTVNEVVNGLLTDGARPGLPLLAVVPGGSTNVFVRMLGLPEDPVEATGEILDGLRSGRTRPVGLGRAGERWFTFNAGFGWDAEVVRRIERRRRAGDVNSQSRYVRRAVRHFFFDYDRRHPAVTLDRPGEETEQGLFYVMVANAAPWTYLRDRPVHLAPEASFDTGLDVFAPRTMRTLPTLRFVAGALRGTGPRGRKLLRLHDLGEFTLRADRPMGLQTDGDYLGEHQEVRVVAVPGAVRVVV
jgi:diacylglycerol kinase family enzyme